MDCERVDKLAPLWASNDLSPDEERLVLDHASNCALCASQLIEFEGLRKLTLNLPAPEFSQFELSAMRARVREQLESPKRAWFQGFFLKPLLGAAVLLLVIAATWLLFPRKEQVLVATQPPYDAPPREMPKDGASVPVETRTIKKTERHRISFKPIEVSPPLEPKVVASVTAVTEIGLPDLEKAVSERLEAVADKEMIRMEFQTQDPNITIIWLTPKEIAGTTGK